MYQKFTEEPYSLLAIDTTFSTNNPLFFRNVLIILIRTVIMKERRRQKRSERRCVEKGNMIFLEIAKIDEFVFLTN